MRAPLPWWGAVGVAAIAPAVLASSGPLDRVLTWQVGEREFSVELRAVTVRAALGLLVGYFTSIAAASLRKRIGRPVIMVLGSLGALAGSYGYRALGLRLGLGGAKIPFSELGGALVGSLLLVLLSWAVLRRLRRARGVPPAAPDRGASAR